MNESKPLSNARHEKFALCLFQGMSLTDAALQSGYSKGNVGQCASRLYKNVEILSRLKALQKSVLSRSQSKKEEKLLKLEEIFSHEPLPESISARDRVWAIAEHNKMAGDYAPEKHINLNVNVKFVVGRGYVAIGGEGATE